MPVINGVYLKDFTALPGAVADADIIPIAITGNQIAYRTTVAGIVTDARITAKLLTGLSVTGGAVVAADTILQAFGKVQNQINGKQGTITLTTTGTSGAATFVSNTLNIPQYADAYVGTVTSVGLSSATSGVTIGSTPVTTSGTITIAIATATSLLNGLLSSTDWTTFNNKQGTITLTTTGTSGAATFSANTLNIPNYGSALTGYVPYTGATTDVDLGAFKLNAQSLHVKGTAGNGHLGLKHQSSSATAAASESSLFADSNGDMSFQNANLYLNKFVTSANSANRTYTFPDATGTVALVGGSGVGTVTSVAALTLGTTGTDLSSTVATGTTTPVITLQVPTASASNRGALSSADWSTFNGKQGTITLTTTGTSGAATFSANTLNIPQYQASGTYVTSVTGTSPIVSSGGTTPAISIPVATTSVNGYLSSTDWTTFNNKAAALSGTINTIAYWNSATTIASLALATYPSLTELSYVKGVTSAIQTQLNAKQATITLTTTGTSGVATFVANTLNIPNYGSALSGYVPYTGATQTLALGTNNGITLTDTSTNVSISITSSSTGSGAIYVDKSGAGTGIQVANNGTGFGFYANNISTGYGITIGNSSTGKGLYIDNAAAATGDPFVYTLGGAAFVKAKIDYLGNITGVAANFTGQLTLGSTITNGTYTYTLPSATGTLALTSALTGYLPLTGGTLTGALSGTSATFSSTVSATQYTATSTGGSGLRVYGSAGTNQWDIYLNSTNLRFSDNTGTGSVVFDRPLSGTSATFSGDLTIDTNTLYVDSTNNRVGIGTTSPGSILDVQQSNATNMGISFMNTFGATSNTAQTVDITSKLVGSGLTGQVGSMIRTGKEGDYSSGAARDAYMSFSTALNDTLTERMRITSGGYVLIAKTSSDATVSGCELSSTGAVFTRNGDALLVNRQGSDGDAITIRRSNVTVGTISVTSSATAYNTSSDYRLKEDLKQINGLEKVQAIKVYDFKWKSEDSRMDGVIAHELAEVLPYAVHGEKDAEEMQGVDYSKLVPIMIKAIQELKAEIDLLKGITPIEPTDNNLE